MEEVKIPSVYGCSGLFLVGFCSNINEKKNLLVVRIFLNRGNAKMEIYYLDGWKKRLIF